MFCSEGLRESCRAPGGTSPATPEPSQGGSDFTPTDSLEFCSVRVGGGWGDGGWGTSCKGAGRVREGWGGGGIRGGEGAVGGGRRSVMREGGWKGGGRLPSVTSSVEAPGGGAAPGRNREAEDECVSEVDCGLRNIRIPVSVPESHQRGICNASPLPLHSAPLLLDRPCE